MNPLALAFIGLAFLVGLVMMARLARNGDPTASTGTSPRTSTEPMYEALPALLTPAERSFFGVLQQVVPPSICLFSKVRLADLIQPRSSLGASTRQSAFNKISSKYVDFALCDAATTQVICAIELDDASHHRGSRQARDSFVYAALQFAAIPVVRFNAQHGYAVEKIRAELGKAGVLVGNGTRTTIQAPQADDSRFRPTFVPAA